MCGASIFTQRKKKRDIKDMFIVYLTITALYSFICLLLGLSLIKLISQGKKSYAKSMPVAIVASGFLLGQGVFANAWMLLGLGSYFNVYVVWGILIFVLLAGAFFVKDNVSAITAKLRELPGQVDCLPFEWKALLSLIALLAITLGFESVIAPPYGDAEGFYMVLPKIMASSERLIPQVNFNIQSQMGLSGEMHYAALMLLADPQVAKLFTWITAVALSLMLMSICSEGGILIRGKIIAMVMLLTSSAFTNYICNGKVDIYGGAFGLAAYFWALKTDEEPSSLAYILAGLFTGFAAVAKFSNIPVVVPGVMAIVAWNHLHTAKVEAIGSNIGYPKFFKGLTLVAVFIFAAILPHLFKNYELFSEPLAPFFFFSTEGYKWADVEWFSRDTTNFILKTYPIALIFGQYPTQEANLSALTLSFAPLILLHRESSFPGKKRIYQITSAAILGVVIWVVGRPSIISPRYIMATLLLFVPLAAVGAERIFLFQRGKTILKSVMLTAMSLMLAILIFQNYWTFHKIKNYILGIRSTTAEYSAYSKPLLALNDISSVGDRIYLAGFYSYYLRPDLLQCLNGDDDRNALKSCNTAGDRWECLYKRGFKYLLIQSPSHKWMIESFKPETAPTWMTVSPVYRDDRGVVFKITSNDPGKRPGLVCRQIHHPAWDLVETY